MQRFFDEGQPQEPGVVIIDSDQIALYERLRIPGHWERLTVPPLLGFVAKANRAFAAHPNEAWYAWGGDDAVGRTPSWDTRLARLASAGSIAWGNDLMRGGCTHPFLPGDLCRAFGWVAHPAFKHLYIDQIWEHVARQTGIARYLPNVIQEAHHFSNNKLARDRTSYERMETADHATFLKLDLTELMDKARLCVSSRS